MFATSPIGGAEMEKAKELAKKHWGKALIAGHLGYFGNAFAEGNYMAAVVASMIMVGLVCHLNVGE